MGGGRSTQGVMDRPISARIHSWHLDLLVSVSATRKSRCHAINNVQFSLNISIKIPMQKRWYSCFGQKWALNIKSKDFGRKFQLLKASTKLARDSPQQKQRTGVVLFSHRLSKHLLLHNCFRQILKDSKKKKKNLKKKQMLFQTNINRHRKCRKC